MAAGALGGSPGGLGRGHVPALAGPPGGDLQARGSRRALAGGADDLRVFVRSERAAQRVFDSVCGVIERRLRLKVNREKSSIRHAADATLLGFGFSLKGPQVTLRVAPKAITRLKNELRVLTRRNWGVSMEYRIGQINRFIIGSPGVPSLLHDVAPEAPRRAFATHLQACGARCRCWSDARGLRTGRLVQHLWRDYPVLIDRRPGETRKTPWVSRYAPRENR